MKKLISKCLILILLQATFSYAGRVEIFGARNRTQAILVSTTFKNVVSFTNTFIESGKLLVFADGMFNVNYGTWEDPFEAVMAIRQNEYIIGTSRHYQDGFTNRTGFACTSMSIADVLDILPGENIIELAVKTKIGSTIYLREPVLNMIFVPDNGSSVSCYVARVEGTEVYHASNGWHDIISTNLDLGAGDYLVVGTASLAPAVDGEPCLAYLRSNISDTYLQPEAEVDLKNIGGDDMDRSVVVSRGSWIGDLVVTNFKLQVRNPYNHLKSYRSALFIVYQPANTSPKEFNLEYSYWVTSWWWSASSSNFETKSFSYSEPQEAIQISSFTLYTTNATCRPAVQLMWNNLTDTPLREEELANGINLSYSFPGHLTWFNSFAGAWNHDISTEIKHGFNTPPNSLNSPSRWQCVISVPIPEPGFYLSFIIGNLIFLFRKIKFRI